MYNTPYRQTEPGGAGAGLWKRGNGYLSVYPGVSAAMAGVYFIPAETAQLDPENDKYKASLKENSATLLLIVITLSDCLFKC